MLALIFFTKDITKLHVVAFKLHWAFDNQFLKKCGRIVSNIWPVHHGRHIRETNSMAWMPLKYWTTKSNPSNKTISTFQTVTLRVMEDVDSTLSKCGRNQTKKMSFRCWIMKTFPSEASQNLNYEILQFSQSNYFTFVPLNTPLLAIQAPIRAKPKML